MSIFLSSFYPMAATKAGKIAAEKFQISKYVDGSCRREPDFENQNPAITAVCRPGFVDRLQERDIVIYITNKLGFSNKKLIAILHVLEISANHSKAAEWYNKKNLLVPNNIFVPSNKPFPLEKTHKRTGCSMCSNDIETIKNWDNGYKERVKEYPKVAICDIWNNHIYLENPPEIPDKEIEEIFGRLPGTKTPPNLKADEWVRFQEWLNKKTGKMNGK